MPYSYLKLILAPMAGFTDQPFRRLARRFGADEVVTELVSANALVRDNKKTFDMIRLHDEEKPASVQIFGKDPAVMAEAARRVEEGGCHFIDINMGCPVRKVVKAGAGSALLDDPQLAAKIVEEVVKAVKTPVSVKIRTGKNSLSKSGLEVARLAAGSGASRIILHARSVADGFTGPVDYEAAARIKNELSVELIVNGGIFCFEDAKRWVERTGCEGLMIGRGALGHPSIFNAVKNGTAELPAESEDTVLLHLKWMDEFYGEKRAAMPIRGHLMHYSKGLASAGQFRKLVCEEQGKAELEKLAKDYFGRQAVNAA